MHDTEVDRLKAELVLYKQENERLWGELDALLTGVERINEVGKRYEQDRRMDYPTGVHE